MELYLAYILLVIIFYIIFELRLRKPDQIVLYDKKGIVQIRTAKFYPRHFSLIIPGTIYSLTSNIECDAKGKILVKIRIILSVAPSPDNLTELIQIGGWNKDAIIKATKELEISLQGTVKEFAEKYEIEGLTSENLSKHLLNIVPKTAKTFGLNIVALNVQSLDPADEKIVNAMQQLETARIMEQTEKANQDARIKAHRTQIDADEKIAFSEHELEMKKYKLKKEQEQKNAEIADQRIKDELERRKKQLEFDRKEIELIKDNPELIVLTPQVARLAEASQSLRNAKTVVNLSANDAAKGSNILDLFQAFLKNALNNQANKSVENK